MPDDVTDAESSFSDDTIDIDLYQARMLIAFHRAGMDDTIGTMEAFVRSLPAKRRFLVTCGNERVIQYIKKLRIGPGDIRIFKLAMPEIEFDDALCNWLMSINFAKELKVRAIPDGCVSFANQPFLSISGPVGMVQYVEKKILSILNHDIRIASKAARIFVASRGRPLFEFGGRRHGDYMSAEAARAAFIGGFAKTSSLLALGRYGIPAIGTMGHVWVMAYTGEDGENDAYKEWSRQFKDSVYLPDTYHTYTGIEKIVKACKNNVGGIRFDSGNILEQARWARRYLDNHDLRKTTLGATNDLNEYKIKELLDHGAPLDWFGVGTEVVCTPDAPTCNAVYKLVQVDRNEDHYLVCKLAGGGKATLPGAKQVFRHLEVKPPGMEDGQRKFSHDTLGLVDEHFDDVENVLQEINVLTHEMVPATMSRDLCLDQLSRLPGGTLLQTEASEGEGYEVLFSDKLCEAQRGISKFTHTTTL